MTDPYRRREAVRDLAELRVPVDRAVAALDGLGSSREHVVYTLTAENVLNLLARHRDGALSTEDCRRWVRALRECVDVGLEPEFADLLERFLASPVTPEWAAVWAERLRASGDEFEPINGFAGRSEFRRFQQWITDRLADGTLTEVPVTSPYGQFDERWFRTSDGQTWRWVWQDGPFNGLFARVR
ncbi:hypothetical protein EV193_105322 [Herbihabitans rhizosphaerae]|uniref:Uncharacterized protein n=1 Tax=Herbihabitans rhizosphaerae TaxID=1872711 RepID=A0A4Q7KN27_9PSEU|nr:hypothetical protein [Herbihabitans rhizosphaerae]RZS37764.1 hypothetical protein EV193_105322 [Herbihabitans rhizosphaerae]